MSNQNDLRKNNSGCCDPTAYSAIMNVSEEEARFHKLLSTIHYICKIAGFQIKGRIVFMDERTGRVWR